MHSYLPKLKTGNENTVAVPATAGSWNDDQAKRRLHDLARAIDVPAAASQVHSIPDPWARVILFDRALFDPDHGLHRQVLGEWRGLLAILGLKERRKFSGLQVAPVTLSPATWQKGMFSSVIARVLPNDDDLIAKDTTWSSFYILRWHKEPFERNAPAAFALTSPMTLVATGASYPGVMSPGEVDWFDGQILRDPTAYLSAGEKRALAGWLMWVRSQLMGIVSSRRRGLMLDLLETFAKDLVPGQQPQALAETSLSGKVLNLHHGIFRYLNRPAQPEMVMLSEVEIVSDRPAAPVYVLIEPTLAQQLNRPAKEIVVHRDVTLTTAQRLVQPQQTSGRFERERTEREINWCTSAFFFQSHLIFERTEQNEGAYSEKASNPFPGCREVKATGNSGNRQIVLPLTEEVTELFTPGYLAENFSVEWLPGGGATCSLKLQLRSVAAGPAGPALAPHWVTVQTTYGDKEMIRIRKLPAVCLWPNFRFPDDEHGVNPWKKYFLFESWRGMSKSEDFVVKPLRAEEAERRQVLEGTDVFQSYAVDRFPEFLICEMPRDKASYYDTKPKGLLVLNPPETPAPARGRKVALGIDFGTTGTGIYRSWGDQSDDIERMSFKGRLFPITDYDKNDFERLTRELFIPGREWSTGKILSVFQDFKTPARIGERAAVLDGHVLFLEALDPGSFIAGDRSGIRSNLKWGDAKENDAACGFLTQLCMQSVAELVCEGAETVDIRYSYPTAFSNTDVSRWKGIWGRVIANAQTATSARLTPNGEGVENREAVAATRFFSHYKGHGGERLTISRGALTIDIGGGTTDLAVWHRDEKRQPILLAHLSILFAGRDIFLAPIRKRPSVLTEIYSKIPLQTGGGSGGDAAKAQLDAYISAYGDQMLKELPFKDQAKSIRNFLAILELGLCGIAFYSGLLVGRLIHLGSYQPGLQIPVFVGGNGSKLLKWCALGDFNEQAVIHQKFARCLLAGCTVSDPLPPGTMVKIIPSDLAKEEVAYGLVVKSNDPKISDDFTNPLAGERFTLAHGPDDANPKHDWNESPNLHAMIDAPIEVERDLPIFRIFLKAMNLTLTDAAIDGISGSIDDAFAAMTKDLKKHHEAEDELESLDPVRKEPIFIMALKHLLDTRINKWVADV